MDDHQYYKGLEYKISEGNFLNTKKLNTRDQDPEYKIFIHFHPRQRSNKRLNTFRSIPITRLVPTHPNKRQYEHLLPQKSITLQ